MAQRRERRVGERQSVGQLNLILPIETEARELDGRLFLAAHHARRSHRVFVGATSHTHRLVRQMQGGVYFGKHIMFPSWEEPVEYLNAKAHGFVVAHLSEEGAVFLGDEPAWREDLHFQLDPRVMQEGDFVCAWGDFQREYYRAECELPANDVRTTGHVRFDIYKAKYREFYREDVLAIRKRFGNFVLMNSNFCVANDAEGPHNVFVPAVNYDPGNVEKRLRFIGRWSRVARTLPSYVELIHHLAVARPDVSFVVRPHPGDNVAFFRAAFGGVANVHVVLEGTVAPWIIAANAVLHDGCTTALESYMVGTPIVNFTPVNEPEHEFMLTNAFGTRARTFAEAKDAVLAALTPMWSEAARFESDPDPTEKLPPVARELFANLSIDSLAETCAVLEECERRIAGPSRGPSAARVSVDELRDRALARAKDAVRPILYPLRHLTRLHGKQRFPGFRKEDIAMRLERLAKQTGVRLGLRFHSPDLFEIESDRR